MCSQFCHYHYWELLDGLVCLLSLILLHIHSHLSLFLCVCLSPGVCLFPCLASSPEASTGTLEGSIQYALTELNHPLGFYVISHLLMRELRLTHKKVELPQITLVKDRARFSTLVSLAPNPISSVIKALIFSSYLSTFRGTMGRTPAIPRMGAVTTSNLLFTHASLTCIPRLGNAGRSFLEGCHPGGSGRSLWLGRCVWDLSQGLPSPADSGLARIPPITAVHAPTPASQHHYSSQEVPTLTAYQPRSSGPAMQDALMLQSSPSAGP